MTQESDSNAELAAAMNSVEIDELADRLVADAVQRGVQLTGDGGLLTRLTKQVLQSALEAEMSAHLGYDKHEAAGRNGGNSRNGTTPKTITTEIGTVQLDVPRDREGTFAPAIVPKHRRRLDGFNEQVISLYAKGMTTGDIARYLEDVYDTDISRQMISTVTEQVTEDLRAWQSRPLDPVHPVILIDAIVVKIREGMRRSARSRKVVLLVTSA